MSLSLLPDLCSNLLFHRRLREEMMRRTMEKTSKGALPVSSLSYSFPRLSSKPLSMPLVSPTLAGLRIIMLVGGCKRITACVSAAITFSSSPSNYLYIFFVALFHRRLREEMMRRTTEKTASTVCLLVVRILRELGLYGEPSHPSRSSTKSTKVRA